MNYEKKYDEALERARKLKENPQSVFNEYSPKEGDTICDYIFPELKKSEDEKIRKEIIAHCRNTRCVTEEGAERIAKWIAWLEKQGEQKPQRMISAEAKEAMYGKPAYAWNEEDEEMLRSIMATCELAEQERDSSPAKHLLQMQLNWLKSLKLKATWKPSDEQMEALFVLLPTVCNGNPAFSLYNDLKKLKGE